MYELLLSADFMVPDPDAMAESLHQRLGIHKHPNWRQAFPNHTYIAWFLRVHKAMAVAPTRLEPQGHLDKPNLGDPLFPAHLEGLSAFQGHERPLKTHSTVLVAKDVMEVADRLARKRLPFRVARVTPEMPFDRLWVGVTPERPHYEPSVDGGLCLEFIPFAPLQMPKEVYDTPPPEPRDAKPGDLLREPMLNSLVRLHAGDAGEPSDRPLMLASQITERFLNFYHHAVPFDRRVIEALWSQCTFEECEQPRRSAEEYLGPLDGSGRRPRRIDTGRGARPTP
jgi:hypothetical protein